MYPKTNWPLRAVLVAFASLLYSCQSAPTAPGNTTTAHRMDIGQSCSTFMVNNLSTKFSGTVGIIGQGASDDIPVTGIGSFGNTICFAPAVAVVNADSCWYPDTTLVPLGNGASVRVNWQNSNAIVIIDYGEQN